MSERIAVVGAGAIGGPIAALLARAGHDVAVVDQWPEHVDAMRERGLRVTVGAREGPEADHVVPVRAYHVHEAHRLRDGIDVVFLACKSYDTRWLVQLVEPYLAADGVVVSVQNSLNEEWIVPIVGPGRVVGCVLTGGGELLGPGHAWRNRGLDHSYYTLGELDGSLSPRLERLAAVLRDAGRTALTTNVWGARWSKLVSNCVSAALSALVDERRRSWHLIDDAAYREASVRLGTEAIRVAQALGIRLEPLFGVAVEELLRSPDEVIARFISAKSRGASEGATNMIQQDLRRGRPTEVLGYLNGLVVRKGAVAAVATPWNAALVELFRRIERGELSPGIANLELLVERLPARVG